MAGILALGQVIVTTLAARRIGRWFVSSRWEFERQSLQAVLEIGFGWMVLSFYIFAMTLAHKLSFWSLFCLFLVLAVLACVEVVKGFRISDSAKASAKSVWANHQGVILGLVAYAIWIFLCASLPATARDELIYHLEVPKELLRSGGAVLFPDNIYAYFPQLGDMLMLFGLALSGELGARLFHAFSGAILGFAIYGFSLAYVARRYAFWAVLLFLSVPSVMVSLSWAYVDLIFSLYVFLGIIALLQYFESGGLKWMVLSGLMIGAATATKYTGFQLCLLFLVLILVIPLITREGRILRSLACFLLPGMLLAVAYPIRNFLVTGWPLFPFQVGTWTLHPFFNWDPERAGLYLGWLGQFGTPLGRETIWHTILAPVLVFIRGRFNEPEFYEGVIGPVFLLLPVVLFRVKKHFPIRILIFFSILFLFSWAVTTKQVRFLFPVLPILSFLIVYGLSRSRIPLIRGAVMLAVFIGFGIGVREVWIRDPSPYWMGFELREAYLRRQLPHYEMLRKADDILGPQDHLYLVHMKNYGYYLDCDWRSDFVFERYSLDRLLENDPSVSRLAAFFRERGISHLMIDENFIRSPEWGFELESLAVFQNFIDDFAKPIFRHSHFALYQLGL